MKHNLNAESLGISGRHNELIELTLTYKFRGFDLDMQDLLHQIEARGRDHATRFLQSANVNIGSFQIPTDLASTEEAFAKDLQELQSIAELAESLGATHAIAQLRPFCDGRAYHEDFELHRERVEQVAAVLLAHQIRLGLGFVATKEAREQGDSQFIATPDAMMALLQMTGDVAGLCLDTWHWHVGGGSVEQLRDFPVERIVMVRLADAPEGVEVDALTEEQRMLPGSTGVVPNGEWLSWLHDQGYDGPVTPYCHPAQFSGLTRSQVVEQAAESLTNLLREPRDAEVSAKQ